MKPIEVRYDASKRYPYIVVFDEPTNPQAGTIHKSVQLKQNLIAVLDSDDPVQIVWAMPGGHLGNLITMNDLSIAQQKFIDLYLECNKSNDTGHILPAGY